MPVLQHQRNVHMENEINIPMDIERISRQLAGERDRAKRVELKKALNLAIDEDVDRQMKSIYGTLSKEPEPSFFDRLIRLFL